MTDPVTMSYLDAIITNTLQELENIQVARDYYRGKQPVTLTARQKEYLSQHENIPFRMNVCHTVVNALANELALLGMSSDNDTANEWASKVFDACKLDALQDDVHEAALSDGETFAIVDWHNEAPRIVHNQRYIPAGAGGDGLGCWMVYENNDPNQDRLYAIKQWVDVVYTPAAKLIPRRTIYYPDRIERYFDPGGGWAQYVDDDGVWPIPWTASGKPLGIPVFHFTNKTSAPEHWDAIPMQDAVNKTLADIMAANDLTAFKSFFLFGSHATTDGRDLKKDLTNAMKIGPGQVNSTENPDAKLQEISGADNTPLVEFMKELVLSIAQITDTPASRFITTAQIASADTLQAQKMALTAKASDRRGRFGDTWSAVFDMCRKVDNAYSGKNIPEDAELSPVWKTDMSMDELAEKVNTLKITKEQAWREAGYSAKQVAVMQSDPEYRVEFEKQLWDGFNAAAAHGISLETYLTRLNLTEDEIALILSTRGTDAAEMMQ